MGRLRRLVSRDRGIVGGWLVRIYRREMVYIAWALGRT